MSDELEVFEDSEGLQSGNRKYSWPEIDAMYLACDLSVREFAEKYKLVESTVRAHVTKNKLHEIRDNLRVQSQSLLIQSLVKRDYKIQQTRFEALEEMIEKFRNDPLAKVTASEALAAVKQIGTMLGEADKRVEHTVLVYDIGMDAAFPEPKIVENEADLIEGEIVSSSEEKDVEEG